ncbi:MAG: SpoIIE family protein phosphatase [Spirochaeta sp.]|nr:SpoIIE family protein phosphatase [Spirochaeta sp.]
MITTALSIRIVSSFFFLVVARYFRVIGRRSEFSPFVEIALVFLLRDLAAITLPDAFFPYTEAAAFAGTYLLFLGWTGGYRRSNRSFRLAVAFTGVVTLVVLLSRIAPAELGSAGRFLFWLFPPGMIAFGFLGITRIDRYTSPRGFDIEMLQPWLQALLVVLAMVHMVVPFLPGQSALILGWLDMAPFLVTMFFLFNLYVVELRGKGRSLRRNAQSIFAFLSGVGNALGQDTTPAAILTSAIDTMVDATDGDGGVAVIVERAGSRVCAVNGLFPPPFAVPDVVKTKPGALQRYLESMTVTDDVPIWAEALRTGRPRLIARASGDLHYAQHATDRTFLLRSVLVLPLYVRGRVLGLLSVIRRGGSQDFTHSDFDHARTMANFVAVTLDNYFSYIRMAEGQRLQRDVEIAGEIQAELQAAADIERGMIFFSGLNRPVRGLGGDYYDVIPLDRDRTAVVICDVSGKGVPAALVMVMVRTIAHIALQETQDAGIVLSRINTGLTGSVAPDRFATVSVAIFDPENDRVSYANAGHHPLMLARTDGGDPGGGIDEIDAEGLPVGIEPDGDYTCRQISFPPGTTALLYTDGVVEALNSAGEEYGTERVTAALGRATAQDRHSRIVLDELMADVDTFIGGAPVQDDITMLVCSNRSRLHPLQNGE